MVIGGVQIGISNTKEGQKILNCNNTTKITNTITVTIKKDRATNELVGIDSTGYRFWLTRFQNDIKIKKQYKLYLNDYDRVMKVGAI